VKTVAWKCAELDNCFVLYILSIVDAVPSVTASVTVDINLSVSVSVSVNGLKVDVSKFSWVLGGDGKLFHGCWVLMTSSIAGQNLVLF